MKFKVELDSCEWDDEDIDFDRFFKIHVMHEIENKLRVKYSEKIDEQIQKTISNFVKETLGELIENGIKVLFEKDVIKISDTISCNLKEFVEMKFHESYRWKSPEETIRDIVSGVGEELKKRYDLLFASQIISKINDLGFLKPGVDKILLDTKEKND